MPDPTHFSKRMRDYARIIRGENMLYIRAGTALKALRVYIGRALQESGYDASVLDTRNAAWRAAITADVLPAIEDVFGAAFEATARGTLLDATAYTTRHLEAVTNRLVNTADTVFDTIRADLAEGRLKGEGIPELTGRVQTALTDHGAVDWKGRARTIARTETIAANNAGAAGAARALATHLGVEHAAVVKEWLATGDARTRPSHLDADGQQVDGLDSTFDVGGSPLDQPGDPMGDPAETVNCRCTVLFHYPGDPDYPVAASASTPTTAAGRRGTMSAEEAAVTTAPPETDPDAPGTDDPDEATHDGAVIVALPVTGDPCLPIGDETKHATLIYFDATVDLDAITSAVQGWTGSTDNPGAAFSENVTSVDSMGDDGARVWLLDGSTLSGMHDSLAAVDVIGTAMSTVEQYPTFTPHVTIGYPATVEDPAPAENDAQARTGTLDEATETAAAAIKTIAFDRLSIWVDGQDPIDVPLVAAADAPEAPADPTQASLQAADLPEDTPPPAGAPAAASDIAPDGDPWYGVLAPEGILSGDNRKFSAGALTWRDLPLPLMYQDAQAMGHDGAVRVGRIDTIERDETSGKMRATGVWDTSPTAIEAQRQVDTQMLRGVSVDCDEVTVNLEGSDGQPLDPMVDDWPEDDVVIENATAARIAGATLCSIPAFQEAYVANGVYTPGQAEPGDGEAPLQPKANTPPAGEPVAVTASAWALLASAGEVAPAAFFDDPGLAVPTALTLTDDGHVYGHLAVWGTCHIGIDGMCQEPPSSHSGYAYFATGVVSTTAGDISTGPLTMDTGHAAMNLKAAGAVSHYDNTGTVVADVVMGEDFVGIWFSGRVRPDLTEAQRYAIRAAGAVSGDWRSVGSYGLELVAGLVVNVPGFPVPRAAMAASAGRPAALVASGVVLDREPAPAAPLDEAALYRSFRARMAREARGHAALSRIRTQRIAAAARRMRAQRLAAAAARMEG